MQRYEELRMPNGLVAWPKVEMSTNSPEVSPTRQYLTADCIVGTKLR